MKQQLLKRNFKLFASILFVFIGVGLTNAQTNTLNTSGNWNTAGNWSLGVPTSAHDVVVPNNRTLTVNTAAVCNSFVMESGNQDVTVTISGTNSLTVTGLVDIDNGTGTGDDRILDVGSGTLSCASVLIQATGNNNRDSRITVSTGTLNVTGNFVMEDSAVRNLFVFSGAGTLNIGGTMTGGSFTESTSTVNYNGSGTQTIGTYTYNNLTTSTSGVKTLPSGSVVNGIVRIQGNSTLQYGAANLIGTGAFQLNGGTFRTGATTGFTDAVGVLTLLDDSVIALGTGNHTLTFANSSGASWTSGKKLTITGWVGGYNGTAAGGTNPKLFFGTAATHLTTAQKAQIRFFNGTNYYSATQLSTGELVPTATILPGISGFSPSSICTGGTITITGTDFISVSAVRINGVNVASYTVSSTTSISAVLSASNTTGDVTVVMASGTYTTATNLTVNPSPTAVSATASTTPICVGSSINLTSSATSNSASGPVTLINENFNGATNSWTKINNSTGGTPALAAWTLRPNNYNSGSTYGATISSNDASQFYLSDSDMQGSGSTTATILQSPSFSTVGLSAASLSYHHYFRYLNGSAAVEVSTNGTTWTSLNTYTSSQGSATAFDSVTLNLSGYLGQATVYVRFKYDSSWGYYWAVDNVLISGTIASIPATYAWTSTPSGFTSSVQNPTGVSPTVNTTYTVTATNSYGCTASATTSSVVVNPTSVGGTVSGGTTICSGSTSGLLTLTGNTGTVVRWEKAVSPFSSWTTITNTTSTHTSVALTETTQFRAVVQSGVCATANSATTTVTVNLTSVGGTVSGGTAVCTGSTSGLLTLTGNTGTVVRWEKAVSPFSSWTTITNTTSTHTSVALTETTQFRAVVQSGVCSTANSATTTVTVNPTSVGGTVSGGTTICSGSTSALLTLAGNTGSVVRWEKSVSPFSSWTTITNTSTTHTSVALTETTQFRAVVQSGVCATANSASTTVTVNPTSVGGTVTGGTAICSGSTSGVLTLTGNTGTVVRWEKAVSPFSSWTTITNTTSTHTSVALTETTQFRAVVQSGVCATANSATTTVTIGATTWNGTSWNNGAPTSTTSAVISGNYTSSTSITACSLTVTNNSDVIISSGDSVTLNGALTVDSGSSFTLENNANLIQGGTTNVNTGSITVKRNSSALKRQDYTLWSSPVAGQELQAFSPGTIATRFYTYDTSADQYAVVGTPSATNFATSKGYLIRMPNVFPTVATVWTDGAFVGVPNSGDYNYTMTDGGSGLRFNAVGNPYPSPISAADFVGNTTNAANTTGALYFWRKTNNAASPSYCTWTTGGFVTNGEAQVFDPNDVIQTGQGFFVEASGSGTSLEFNNDMRVDDHANQFFRTANTIERNRIWLNLTNTDGLFSQAMVGYMTDATNDIDITDGKYFYEEGNFAFLTSLLNETPYAIQGRSLPFDAADVVPMQFKVTTAGTYAISIDHVDGLFSGSQDIYLRDAQTGLDHDLKSGSYSFTAEAGTFAARFSVVYTAALSVENPTLDANAIVVYKNENQSFTINSGSIIMSSVKVFDIRGRLLTTQDNINASQTIVTAGQANQVLLLQVTAIDGSTVTKKVVR